MTSLPSRARPRSYPYAKEMTLTFILGVTTAHMPPNGLRVSGAVYSNFRRRTLAYSVVSTPPSPSPAASD